MPKPFEAAFSDLYYAINREITDTRDVESCLKQLLVVINSFIANNITYHKNPEQHLLPSLSSAIEIVNEMLRFLEPKGPIAYDIQPDENKAFLRSKLEQLRKLLFPKGS